MRMSIEHAAREIRNGRKTVDQLALSYGTSVGRLSARLREAGWSPATGNRVRPYVPPEYTRPLVESSGGSGTYVGASDRDALPIPTQPVAYGKYGERPRPVGLNWVTMQLRYQGEPITTSPERPSPAISASARQRRPRAGAKPLGTRRGLRGPGPKLSDLDAQNMVERYKNGESSTALAIEYGVWATTVRNYCVRAGVPIRPRKRGVKADA